MPHPISFPPLLELQQTDSTNNYAMQLVRNDMAENGMGILAYHQTDGKGQRTKSWLSEAGKGLNLSVLAAVDFLSPAKGFELLASTAIAVTEELIALTGKEFKIKWPNDLYWQDKKAGGILVQSSMQGKTWKWAIIGVGINVLQDSFPPDIPNPVSLKQISGNVVCIKTLAEKIRERTMIYLQKLKEQGFDEIHRKYLDQLYQAGETVLVRKGQQEQALYISGVTKDGLLETGLEEKVLYAFGELEWVHKF